MQIFVGITGASGHPYARQLVRVLHAAGHDVGVCFSSAALQVTGQELYGDLHMPPGDVLRAWLADTGLPPERVWEPHDFGSPFASGSARWDAAVVVPCSMDTLSTIASGAGSNLVHRAASVALKEQRRLVLVPRETPLSAIHLENMLRAHRAGAMVLPAMPGFYHRPESLDDVVDFMVGKILKALCVEHDVLGEWSGGNMLRTTDAR